MPLAVYAKGVFPVSVGISRGSVAAQAGTVTGRSTNYRRTIATLRGVVTGLYPEAAQPIPAVVAEDVDEVLFGNVEACKRLGGMLKVMQNNLRGASLLALLATRWFFTTWFRGLLNRRGL
jgi:hypothetical protein